MPKVAIVPSTVGFHWEELYDAYKEFKEENWQIDIYTVEGKPAEVDPRSIKKSPLLASIGLGVTDSFSPDTKLGKKIMKRMKEDMKPIEELDPVAYDAIYLPGGHGCLFDVNTDETLHQKIHGMYNSGKILSAVCHATSTFAFVRDDGKSILDGREVTGFPQKLDDVIIKLGWVHDKFLPLPFSNEQKMKDAGARMNTTKSLLNPAYTVKDRPFITGVGPKAASNTAKLVIKAYKKSIYLI